MDTQESLRQRFKKTWSTAIVTGDDNSEEVCRLLFDELNGPRRYYHGPEHIRHCLSEYDQISNQCESPLAVELAIWFHDFIYHSESGEDERESADRFVELAAPSLQAELIPVVKMLIIATAHHGQIEEAESDLAFLLDIDLASLGADWDRFMADGDNLRKEEPDISDHQYYFNKTIFFNLLEGLDRIYKSDFFYRIYENNARNNLLRHRRWLEREMPDLELP